MATAKILQHRIDELSHRAAVLGPRVGALTAGAPDGATARGVYQQAVATIDERRKDLQQQLPRGIEAAKQSGKPEDFVQLIDRLRETQEASATRVDSALSAVESWAAIAEQRQLAPRSAAARTEPDPTDQAPGGSGSQAPVR